MFGLFKPQPGGTMDKYMEKELADSVKTFDALYEPMSKSRNEVRKNMFLAHIRGGSYDEISKITGCSVAEVKSVIKNAEQGICHCVRAGWSRLDIAHMTGLTLGELDSLIESNLDGINR